MDLRAYHGKDLIRNSVVPKVSERILSHAYYIEHKWIMFIGSILFSNPYLFNDLYTNKIQLGVQTVQTQFTIILDLTMVKKTTSYLLQNNAHMSGN